uniref:Uncharacterized protein n=1 Tax=Picea glauca TaxID=3330 RepID=A0A124GMP4_PICGL|nr:hypothetical protein ABT39_MTgene1819 [Picea glauca]QHR91826.1 hypothetical protein Q903MT_gene5862 [Picea sitchensis]
MGSATELLDIINTKLEGIRGELLVVITFYLEEMLAQILLLTWSKTCQKRHIYQAITRARNRNRRWVMCCLINWFFNRCRSSLLS